MAKVPPGLSQSQRERLAFLELHAFFTGDLQRNDIEHRFGVKPAAASRDIALYKEIAPHNLDYDVGGRCYRPTGTFKSVFGFQPSRVLSWLLQGFGDGLDLGLKQVAACEGPGYLMNPDMKVLGAITRAICAKRALQIEYVSLSSDTRFREVVPVALADNGLRWHVRAYDRERQRFADFVLTRITATKPGTGLAAESELLEADTQWNQMLELELVPHPGLHHPEAIEADFCMKSGALALKTRAALAGYVLRRWSVDSSLDHSLEPVSHHLWLRNGGSLVGIDSAHLAPGWNLDAWTCGQR